MQQPYAQAVLCPLRPRAANQKRYGKCPERAGQIRVEYKKSAVMGDIIYPKMAVEEQRKIVELCDAEGNPYAVVEFKEK